MNIKQKSSPKKKIIIAVVAAVIIAGSVGAYFFYQSSRAANQQAANTQAPVETINYNPPTQDERSQTDEHKEDIIKQEQKENESEPTGNIQVTIVRATQNAGQPLNIRAIISGATSGTCAVTLTKAGQPTITKSYAIAMEATSASCSEANIPASDFPVGGEWQLQIVAKNSSNATSPPATQAVTITK